MATLQEIVIFAVIVSVMVVFMLYFYYRGEEIMDHMDGVQPFIWTSNRLRLDVCELPFSNYTGKCMEPDYCHYVEVPSFKKNLLNCKIFTNFICCPLNDSVLEDPILKQYIARKIVDVFDVADVPDLEDVEVDVDDVFKLN